VHAPPRAPKLAAGECRDAELLAIEASGKYAAADGDYARVEADLAKIRADNPEGADVHVRDRWRSVISLRVDEYTFDGVANGRDVPRRAPRPR
jgi:hypothetical protein